MALKFLGVGTDRGQIGDADGSAHGNETSQRDDSSDRHNTRRSRRRITTAVALALPLLAHAACKVQTLELPVKMVGSRAVATVGINGTTVPLTVDSGAFFSFLTEAAAAQLKLPLKNNFGLRVQGLTGMVDTYTTRVDKLQLLEGELSRVEFVVGGNEPGAGTMGLLGRNILSAADTEYDLAHGVIRFLFPNDDCGDANMAYWAGSAPVSQVDLETGWHEGKAPAIRTRVKLNGSGLVALFDTGATTVVSRRAARRAGVADTAMTPAGSMHGAGRGTRKMWTASFETFEIGGEQIKGNRLPVADFDLESADLLLGIDFFLSHRIYVSKKQSKMYFTYNGGTVFALNKGEAASALAFDADPAAGNLPAVTADQFARRGAASAARRDFANALADLDRACELDPTSASFLAQRGAIQQALKHPTQALGDFDKALALDPTQPEALASRASLRLQTNDRMGAKTDLDVLDRTLAPQSQMRLGMSRLYLNLEQPAKALDQLNQWLPAHPNEIGREAALNSRCWIRLMLGVDLNRALDDCNDAVDGEPENPNYLDSRGWVHLRLGGYKKALSDFDRSIGHRPEGAWSLYGRGLTKTRMGDAAQGESDLAAARRWQPDIDARVTRAGVADAPAPKP